MFNQSISGIKSNLVAFNQAASKVANPYEMLMPREGQNGQQQQPGTGPGLQVADDKKRADFQSAEQVAKAQSASQNSALSGMSARNVKQAKGAAKATNPNAPKETANEPGTRIRASQAVDQAQETVNMMVAQKGAEANLGVLKTAQSLSGQTVNILA
jgi:flagellar basal body rod protein FlgC